MIQTNRTWWSEGIQGMPALLEWGRPMVIGSAQASGVDAGEAVTQLYAPERQQELARWTRSSGRISVAEAALRFDVTPETIRRDLDVLDRAGVLRRVHGGAIPASPTGPGEQPLSARESVASVQKDRIAQAALALLPGDADAIILDSGTTTARFAALIPAAGPTVFTNSPPIAVQAALAGATDVELSGGRVRRSTQACVGPAAVAWFDRLRVDVAFLGANGLSLEHGLSTPDADEAAVKAAMVRAARRVVLLADADKIGVETTCRFAHLGDIDVLVTDAALPDVVRRRLIEEGIEVVVA